jgi:hypothetical protein
MSWDEIDEAGEQEKNAQEMTIHYH